jgi:2-methylcitrate dehydratase PrpD
MTTLIETLAGFAADTRYEALPSEVAQESKRLLLDSLGCALGGLSHSRGQIALKHARQQGPGAEGFQGTVIGGGLGSVHAAAFANAELINALDFDAILPPGHVSPYVIPGALAYAEMTGSSGKEMLSAVAVAHEMSHRIGKAQDYLRDIKDGKISPPPVHGYSSTIFGGTAAIGMVRRLPVATIAHAMGIAGSMAPVNSQWSFSVHKSMSTLKYHTAGALAITATHANALAELGHTGDLELMDDPECGWRRMINTSRWEIERITPDLGQAWWFPEAQSYKPYPHCRILHAPLDALTEVLETNEIRVDEIEEIRAWVEGFVMQPLWLNRDITHETQGQFSIAHGLSVGAHRIPPGKKWQSPDVVYDPSVLGLMDKVKFGVHPDYEKLVTGNAASRPTRIEVRARGQTFVGERRYPKGSPSPDPSTRMTDDEMVAKFARNAEGVLDAATTAAVVEQVWQLDQATNLRGLMSLLAGRRQG